MTLCLRNHRLDKTDMPLVMGVLNVTPDSFSDAGQYLDPTSAAAGAGQMIAEGATVIDVGPESTRPGAQPVTPEEQIKRAIPVIEAIRAAHRAVAISIDTRLAPVAAAAIEAGADLVNDTSALRDDREMVSVVARSGVCVVLMHRRGTPAEMQADGGPHYDHVVQEICVFLRERATFAEDHGIDRSRIILDPGLGFGKRVEHNLMILREIPCFVALGYPLLIGASRKRFIGAVLDIDHPQQRQAGSLACAVIAALAGAAIVRTHDVRPTVEAIRLCAAVGQAPISAR